MMPSFNERLVAISDFLNATSFFWKKELIDQKIEELPEPFLNWERHFQALSLEQKKELINHGQDEKIKTLTDFPVYQDNMPIAPNQRKLTLKKRHELSRLGSYIHLQSPKSLLDLCGGVGHLPRSLSQSNSQIQSLTIDFDDQLIKNGIRLCKDYPHIKFQHFDLKSPQFPFRADMIVGLHTCGDLAEYATRHFIASNSQRFLNVGCCYHKTLNWSPLSQWGQKYLPEFDMYALTVAAKSHKPLTLLDIEKRFQVKSYRYTFEKLLRSHGFEGEIHIGATSSSVYQESFYDYVQFAIKRLSMTYETQKYTPKLCEEYYKMQQDDVKRRIHLGFYRDHWGRVIESAIILDRAIYLTEQGLKCEIYEIFDRALSPRNLLLTAMKED